MKIAFCASYYDPYLQDFYSRNTLNGLSYLQIYDLLIEDYFGVFGLYTENAILLGEQAILIVPNCKPLQQQWALENNIQFDNDNWLFTITIEQIKKYKPDVFFIGSMFNFFGDFLEKIRPHCGALTAWTSCVIPDNISFSQFSLVITSLPKLVSRFREIDKVKSELVFPAFDAKIYDKLKHKITKNIPFSFVGGISGNHQSRIESLTQLTKTTPLELYGYGYPKRRKYEFIKQFLKPQPLISRYRGEAWGLEMYLLLGNSKITFNSHIDMADDKAANMRLFEATGMGSLLLTDNKSNLNELFEAGKEVIAYDNVQDAVEKVNYYLNHTEEREKIAKAGQERTFKEYSFQKITNQMIEYFKIL